MLGRGEASAVPQRRQPESGHLVLEIGPEHPDCHDAGVADCDVNDLALVVVLLHDGPPAGEQPVAVPEILLRAALALVQRDE
eukprot:53863-Prymnesium_polylepis.1